MIDCSTLWDAYYLFVTFGGPQLDPFDLMNLCYSCEALV